MKNFVTISAVATAILFSAMTDRASAQSAYVIGEPGARNGAMCWKPANGDGFVYSGYWTACATPAAAVATPGRRKARRG